MHWEQINQALGLKGEKGKKNRERLYIHWSGVISDGWKVASKLKWVKRAGCGAVALGW